MSINKIFGGRALKIAVGIAAFVMLLAGSADAATFTVDDNSDADYTGIQDAINNVSMADAIFSSSLSLEEAVDNSALNFTSGGDAAWFGQDSVSHFGGDAAQAGRISDSDGQNTWIQTNVTDIGALSFFWKVSSGSGHYLKFYIDGMPIDYISGEVNWTKKSYSIGAGNQTLKWMYVNDFGYPAGSDTGWIDKIELSPTVSIEEAVDNSALNFTSGGNAKWFGQKEISYFGGDAAQSGRISNNQNTWIQTNVTDIGWLSFFWKVYSQYYNDDLEFYIDGVLIDSISNDVNWRKKSYNIGAGNHTLKWKYNKGSDSFYVDDRGWIDKITFSPSDTKFINDNATGGDCISIGIWNSVTKTCTLTTDLGEKIQIDSNGITLDGNGHTITGSNTGNGVHLSSRIGVTIKNLNVNQFNYGIYLASSSNNTLSGNNVSNNDIYGIYLYSSSNNTIISNIASKNYNYGSNYGYGIYLSSSSNNTLISNIASNNNNFYGDDYGIYLFLSDNNMLSSNNASNNNAGIALDKSSNNTLTGNNASYNNFGIFLMYSNNNMLNSNSALNNFGNVYDDFDCSREYGPPPDGDGIALYYSNNNNLSYNNASNNRCNGFYAKSSSSTIFNSNSASNNTAWGSSYLYDGGYGIGLDSSSYSTLINNSMTGNRYNFGLNGQVEDSFNHNIDTSNTVDGMPVSYIKNGTNIVYDSSSNVGAIYCFWCNNITIKNITLKKNSDGIFFWKTNNSKIENVTASANYCGISLGHSSNNSLKSNNASRNICGIAVSLSSNNNTLSGNSALSNSVVNILISHSSDNRLSENIPSSGGVGIILDYSNNNDLSRNNATKNSLGINLIYSSNNILSSNNVSNNANGILLEGANNNSLNRNNASSNKGVHGSGIILTSSSNNNTLSGNNASNNHINGIGLGESSYNNTLSGNNVKNNGYYGLVLDWGANNNTLTENNVSNNKAHGIFLRYSGNNRIFHNNFIKNYYGPALDMTGSNTWDNGYPTGGNYYSDYNDSDTMSGPNQDQPGSDGIGDTPYNISGGAGAKDRYPFMSENGWISPTDILSYYRSLGSNPNIVETTDLLKAADDWSNNIAPPGCDSSITTQQLLILADEWSKG